MSNDRRKGSAAPNTFSHPNIFIDELSHLLTPPEQVVLTRAIREILGWHDKVEDRKARIALSIFEGGIIKKDGTRFSYGCGLGINTIRKAVNFLDKCNILIKVGEPTQDGQEYYLQDNLSDIDWATLDQRKAKKDKSYKPRIEAATRASLASRGIGPTLDVGGTSQVTPNIASSPGGTSHVAPNDKGDTSYVYNENQSLKPSQNHYNNNLQNSTSFIGFNDFYFASDPTLEVKLCSETKQGPNDNTYYQFRTIEDTPRYFWWAEGFRHRSYPALNIRDNDDLQKSNLAQQEKPLPLKAKPPLIGDTVEITIGYLKARSGTVYSITDNSIIVSLSNSTEKAGPFYPGDYKIIIPLPDLGPQVNQYAKIVYGPEQGSYGQITQIDYGLKTAKIRMLEGDHHLEFDWYKFHLLKNYTPPTYPPQAETLAIEQPVKVEYKADAQDAMVKSATMHFCDVSKLTILLSDVDTWHGWIKEMLIKADWDLEQCKAAIGGAVEYCYKDDNDCVVIDPSSLLRKVYPVQLNMVRRAATNGNAPKQTKVSKLGGISI